ncbi:MAG: Mu-like prophage major head subunit gpT family protein [Candidatus Accumulibacter sp.]|jgi:phage major head subunit gpT-like protein|nr:Mu-like prophage major head subunit gpT family protein [Accumulibacter sp.]
MQITPQSLTALAQGFNAAFLQGFESAPSGYQQIAMTIPSTGSAENYGWMKDLPGMREWAGQRVIHNLEATTAQLVNKHWEHTVGVSIDDIEDDKLGIYKTIFSQQGEIAARHPDDLVWGLLSKGFTTTGFDGQPFFDADHAGFDRAGKEVSWSNAQSGGGAAWFLFDLSRNYLKPLIFQSRKAVQFTRKDRQEDDNVFLENTYLFGADARYVAGFGFHQLAFGSRDTLDADNYEAARLALSTQYRPDGSPLAVRPTHLVVGVSNEARARTLLMKERLANGEDNIWHGSAQLIVSPWLE